LIAVEHIVIVQSFVDTLVKSGLSVMCIKHSSIYNLEI